MVARGMFFLCQHLQFLKLKKRENTYKDQYIFLKSKKKFRTLNGIYQIFSFNQ